MKPKEISPELSAFIKDSLEYNPETGLLHWTKQVAKCVQKGSLAGNPSAGYMSLMIKGRALLSHRVAWFLTYDSWPGYIDHINGNKTDNRLSNLRECSKEENGWNRGKNKNGKCGFKGVYFHKSNRRAKPWSAKAKRKGIDIHIGYYATEEGAAKAYKDWVILNDREFSATRCLIQETEV